VGEFFKNKSIPRMKFIGFEGWGVFIFLKGTTLNNNEGVIH
jgi:hypothetical protein